MTSRGALLAGLAFALACSSKSTDSARERDSGPPARVAPASGPAPAPQIAERPSAPEATKEIPTQEDYEEQAEQDVGSRDLEHQLDELEKEIGE